MRYDELKKVVALEDSEADVIDLAIVELGGPLHSPFAKHLQVYHLQDYDRVRKEIGYTKNLDIQDVHLIIDLLQIFLDETLESDWGTTYEDVNKTDVEQTLQGLVQNYSIQVKKY